MMQATGQELVDAQRGLERVLDPDKGVVLPFKLAYRLGRMLTKVRKAARLVVFEIGKLERQCALRDIKGGFVAGPGGQGVAIDPAKVDLYNDEHHLMLTTPVDIDVEPIAVYDIPADLNTKGDWLADLGPFLAD